MFLSDHLDPGWAIKFDVPGSRCDSVFLRRALIHAIEKISARPGSGCIDQLLLVRPHMRPAAEAGLVLLTEATALNMHHFLSHGCPPRLHRQCSRARLCVVTESHMSRSVTRLLCQNAASSILCGASEAS